MERYNVQLNLSESELIIKGDKLSPLLSPEHKIFFANVLGFTPSEGIHGYTASPDLFHSQLINNIMEYLREQGFSVSINKALKDNQERLRANTERLQESKVLGQKLKKHPLVKLEIPQFQRHLKPYQVPAVAHMVEVAHAANFSVPGSGKTTIAYAAFQLLKERRKIDALIVVGPRASFLPWEEEFRGCFGRSPTITRISGSRTSRAKLYREAEESEVTILTYQMAAGDKSNLRRLLANRRFMLVLDESHNIKRFEGGKWSSALLELGPYAVKRVILSGTPLPNSILDLWSQMTFLWPNPPILNSQVQFKEKVHDKHGADEIKNDLFPFYWRIKKSALNLPRPKQHVVKLKMHPYQKAIYDALAIKVLADVVKSPDERLKLRPWRKARMVRLLQAASNPSLLTEYSTEFRIPPLDASGLPVNQLISSYSAYERPVKLDACVDLGRALIAKGHKVLIWSAFVHNIKTLERDLYDLNPATIYGDIPRDAAEDDVYNREVMIHKFKTSPQCHLLLANPAACAESISLHQVCQHAIYLDRTFNGAHYMQSLDRIHRIGLDPKKRVHYYFLIADRSVDQVINERLTIKHKRMLDILDDDFGILDLEAKEEDMSEDSEEEQDFNEMIKHLQAIHGNVA